jgi:hypothetical protein
LIFYEPIDCYKNLIEDVKRLLFGRRWYGVGTYRGETIFEMEKVFKKLLVREYEKEFENRNL